MNHTKWNSYKVLSKNVLQAQTVLPATSWKKRPNDRHFPPLDWKKPLLTVEEDRKRHWLTLATSIRGNVITLPPLSDMKQSSDSNCWSWQKRTRTSTTPTPLLLTKRSSSLLQAVIFLIKLFSFSQWILSPDAADVALIGLIIILCIVLLAKRYRGNGDLANGTPIRSTNEDEFARNKKEGAARSEASRERWNEQTQWQKHFSMDTTATDWTFMVCEDLCVH